MTSDTPLFGTCEICMFGSLLAILFGSLILFVGFRIDMVNNDVFNVGIVILICYLVGIYIVFTFTVTEWRMKFRRRMNDMDSKASNAVLEIRVLFETHQRVSFTAW